MSKRIGNFEIVGRLEAHAGVAAYLGSNTTDGSLATIDIWTPETPDAQSRFLDRAAAGARLEHHGIARIVDFGIDGPTSCRIEEFADGETLAATLAARTGSRGRAGLDRNLRRGPSGKSGGLPRETVLAWLAQIARALEYAHGMSVVHGDLHPGMVTILPDGAAQLRGFANPRTTGELGYRAPELIRGAAVDVRTDLYAFGVLLHRLLTCRPDATPARGLTSRASQSLDDLPSDFPRKLIPALEGCLQDDPADRLDNFTSVVGAVEAAIHDTAAIRDAAAIAGVAGVGEEASTPADVRGFRTATSGWESATAAAAHDEGSSAGSVADTPVRKSPDHDVPLVDVPVRGNDGDDSGKNGARPSELEKAPAAIGRVSRFRRRWLTFATVAGTTLWLAGTLSWSRGTPAVAGSEAPAAEARDLSEPAETDRTAVTGAAPAADDSRSASNAAPAGPAARRPDPIRLPARDTGRLALAPAWHKEITVSVAHARSSGRGAERCIAGTEPIVLDRRRVIELEAGVDHVLAFELATRNYTIQEELTAEVLSGQTLETPVPLERPGFLSVTATDEEAHPVFVRVGGEAIGWTPIAPLALPVGNHMISVFTNPTWRPEERIDQRIDVLSRQETIVQFDLESEPPALIVDGRRIEYAPIDAAPGP